MGIVLSPIRCVVNKDGGGTSVPIEMPPRPHLCKDLEFELARDETSRDQLGRELSGELTQIISQLLSALSKNCASPPFGEISPIQPACRSIVTVNAVAGI